MADLYHEFGSDLVVSATGDLLLATGDDYGRQRVLRRLLTNPGDYIWEPDYGAGLPSFIGTPVNADQLRAVIVQQMLLEAAVSQDTAPQISVSEQGGGVVTATIQYVDAVTGETVPMTVPLK